MLNGHLLPFKCTQCEAGLIRIQQSESDDLVICPECRGVGCYQKVIHKGHKIISGVHSEKQIASLTEELAIYAD